MCKHKSLKVKTEKDRCYWVECVTCGHAGPCKNTYALAVIAFGLASTNQHPRKKAKSKRVDTVRIEKVSGIDWNGEWRKRHP